MTLTTASDEHDDDAAGARGACVASSRRVEPPKSSDFSAGMPAAPKRPPHGAAAAARRRPDRVGVLVAVGVGRVGRSCRLLGADLRGDDLGVGRTVVEQLGVGAEADRRGRPRAPGSGRRR